MEWESIIALVFSGIGVGVSIWAIIVAKKSNKAVLKQNLEKELADIEKELADIDIQVQRAKVEGEESTKGIFGANVPNPRLGEILAQWDKKETLQTRKAEITRQLQQL